MPPPTRRRPALTPRQTEIIALITRGYRAREIAAALGVSERAVRAHVADLKRVFGAKNRSGLIAAALASAGFSVRGSHRRYADAPFLIAVSSGPDHVFTYVNRMWERVFGLQRRTVVGRPVRTVFPHPSRTTYAARQRAYRAGRLATGKAWHYRWTDADGVAREADFRFIYQPLRDTRGRIEGLLLIASGAVD